MASGAKRDHPRPLQGEGKLEPCPACGAALDGWATPLGSIVICAHCCTPLLWDGAFSRLSAEQIDRLPAGDQARLHSIVAAQRARIAARTRC